MMTLGDGKKGQFRVDGLVTNSAPHRAFSLCSWRAPHGCLKLEQRDRIRYIEIACIFGDILTCLSSIFIF